MSSAEMINGLNNHFPWSIKLVHPDITSTILLVASKFWMTSKWVLCAWIETKIRSHFDFEMFYETLDGTVCFEKCCSRVEGRDGWEECYTPFIFLDKLRQGLRLIIIQRKTSAETYSAPSQTSKMELFAEIVYGFQQLTDFTKSSILDV